MFIMAEFMTRIWSPTQLNPLDMNPLRDLMEELVDFAALRARPDVKLFVNASNVRTCKSRIFRTPELTADARRPNPAPAPPPTPRLLLLGNEHFAARPGGLSNAVLNAPLRIAQAYGVGALRSEQYDQLCDVVRGAVDKWFVKQLEAR